MADNVQTWPQQKMDYRPGPPGTKRGTYPGIPQQVGIGGLTREERMEAKRLTEEANFNIKDYQIVRREFISHSFDPAMTIRGNSITFNNSCISKLENAKYIQFLINPSEQKLAIRPCDEGARDAVRWCMVKGDKRKSREITCKLFTTKLYALMGWEQIYRYKLQGMKINYQGESLYLFDLSGPEAFLPQSRDPETGKRKRSEPILPDEWMNSFGLNVEDHTISTQIDLTEGFVSPDMTAGMDESAEDCSAYETKGEKI